MYSVSHSSTVEKQISKLHPNDQRKVIKAIDKLPSLFSTSQFVPQLKKLTGEPYAWRFRVGDVRILFYQNKTLHRLEIYKVDYRGDVY